MKEYTLNLTENEQIILQKQADKHHPVAFMWVGMALTIIGLIMLWVIDALFIYLAYGVLALALSSFVGYAVIKEETHKTIYVTNKRIAIVGENSYFAILNEHLDSIEVKGHKITLFAGEGVVYLAPVIDSSALKNTIEAVLNDNSNKPEPVIDKPSLSKEEIVTLVNENINNAKNGLKEELTQELNEQLNTQITALKEELKSVEPKKKNSVSLKARTKEEKVDTEVEDMDTSDVTEAPVTLDLSKAKKTSGKVKDAKTIVEEKAAALKALENK